MGSAAKRIGLAVAAMGLMTGVAGRAVAGVVLDFEQVPYNSMGYAGPYSSINEDGFALNARSSGYGFYALGPSYTDSYVGSKALYNPLQGSPFATLSKNGGETFTLNSIDLSELSRSATQQTVASFTGYRKDGTSVSQAFTLDGLFGMQTFMFTGFTDMFYVTFTQSAPHQFDRIVLDEAPDAAAVPEPSTLAMGGTAALLGLAYGWRRRKARANA